MKFKIITLFLLTFVLGSTYGQELQRAPINEEFEKFITSKTKATGIIPSPTTYVFSNEINKDIAKFSFPESFDLRDLGLVSAVKDQNPAGHCWSFAAIGAIESRNLKFGLGEYDLSEHNMATCHGYEYEEGGNQNMATAYLSRLSGPILETEDPYDPYDFTCSATGVTPQFYVTEARFLPENMDIIKYMLMNNGAIAVSLHWAQSSYNGTDYTYYYSGNENPNHGVLLVGWDDTKVTAGGTGAWIIKNSWADTWGDNGFFYISYNDTYSMANATIYPIRKETNNIDTILMYDKYGELSSYGYGDAKAYGLIKHSVSEEYIFNKIGTYIGASNSVINIEVFGTKTENTLTDTLATAYNLFAEYPGYYTFDVPFSANGDFYIKVKYYTPGDTHPVPAESEQDGYAYPDIESNISWLSYTGETWELIGGGTDAEADLCIRAYGIKSDIKASFTSDYEIICYDSDVTFTNTSIGNISNYLWDFGKDATPATASTEGPHTVTYSSEGYKTIKLVIENSIGTQDSIINYNFINVNSEIDLNILSEIDLNIIAPTDTVFMDKGDILKLSANGAVTYNWYPSALIIGDNTDSSVEVSPETDTTLYVDGIMGSCTRTDSIRIIVHDIPDNDNVCDAIELTLNEELGPFNNFNATVQANEPFPDTTGSLCTTPGYWCSEGGLQNSVWFKFVAPNSGTVSITTDGFDNQIAVYDAASCSDIVSGNPALYDIIAANDDYSNSNYDAIIDEITGLTSGKTYWLQMDGSAGGDEGECTITITEFKADNDDVCDAIELTLNTEEGPFTNAYATVQANEPFPDTTGSLCTTPGYWCSEGGLQNSVWFKFVAPNSGTVSITTDGFDNQIAVYDAANCSDIVSGNPAVYDIIAANDNYNNSDYNAIIDEISGLTSGKTYWLQMDGSAGGEEGECTITIADLAPDNDSPCNAKTLEFFTSYSENNNYASIDNNEPMPDDSDCSAQNSWCPDDTLNATVWYKFAATSSGVVSIASTGFDNQIAVYSASECADLLSGDPADYTILGANDNYEGSNAASIYSITGLTEGTDYWIQVDGKNSDFYGSFTLYLKEWPLSTEDIIFGENKIIVFPNPNNGEFKIDLSNVINTNKSDNLSIEVVTTDGSVLYKYKGTMNQNEFDISIDRKGLFIVRVITDDHQYSVPVVIK